MFERLRRKLLGGPAAPPAGPTPQASGAAIPSIDPLVESPTTTAIESTDAVVAAAEPPPTSPEPGEPPEPATTIGETLTFNQRRYPLNELSEDVRRLVITLKNADRLIRLKRDKTDLLARGRQRLVERLREGLKDVAPLD